jgi:hypothetical protein
MLLGICLHNVKRERKGSKTNILPTVCFELKEKTISIGNTSTKHVKKESSLEKEPNLKSISSTR